MRCQHQHGSGEDWEWMASEWVGCARGEMRLAEVKESAQVQSQENKLQVLGESSPRTELDSCVTSASLCWGPGFQRVTPWRNTHTTVTQWVPCAAPLALPHHFHTVKVRGAVLGAGLTDWGASWGGNDLRRELRWLEWVLLKAGLALFSFVLFHFSV